MSDESKVAVFPALSVAVAVSLYQPTEEKSLVVVTVVPFMRVIFVGKLLATPDWSSVT